MDPTRFDGVVRSLTQSSTRRRSLGVLVGGALVLLGEAAPGLAKHRHRHGTGKHRPQASAKPTCAKASRCGSTCCPTPDNGTTTCRKGKCDVICNAGFTQCGSSCVDPSTLCGGLCDNVCAGGTTCCGFSCVDTSSDNAHCGTCTQRCGTGTSCASGSCAPDPCGTCTQHTSDTGQCFWLDCQSSPGTCCWVPAPNGANPSNQTDCEAQDQCGNGPCYKWGTASCTASA